MKNNSNRLGHFVQHAAPTPGENDYNATMKYYEERLKKNPDFKKKIENNKKQAIAIISTQQENGINLLQDKELRYFQQEYISRTWQYGLGALPSSINVLEGFFKWRSDLFFFELFDEEEHLFSLYDFFDFVTSDKCS